LEGQVPVFILPRNKETQLYSPSTGFPFVASYDSQGYAKGILTHLQTGYYDRTDCPLTLLVHIIWKRILEKTSLPPFLIFLCALLLQRLTNSGCYMQRRYLATTVYIYLFCSSHPAAEAYVTIFSELRAKKGIRSLKIMHQN
jgi:hypothetical protein